MQKVCRLALQTCHKRFADLPCRIILFKSYTHKKSSLQSQVCKVKSAKSSLQTFFRQVCKVKSANFLHVCLQTLKKFAELLETVTDLTLQSWVIYLPTNFEKLVDKHVQKKSPTWCSNLLIYCFCSRILWWQMTM